MSYKSGCVVCGEKLVYSETLAPASCFFCGATHETGARCANGHYVCDDCHSGSANDLIEIWLDGALATTLSVNDNFGINPVNRVRLGDTDLWVRVQDDRTPRGDEPICRTPKPSASSSARSSSAGASAATSTPVASTGCSRNSSLDVIEALSGRRRARSRSD